MKKLVISSMAALALLFGGFATAMAGEQQCDNTCQSAQQARNGFQTVGRGIEEAAEGSYNTVKNGTVKTYKKAKKGTVRAYNKAKDGTVKTYDKAKAALEKAF